MSAGEVAAPAMNSAPRWRPLKALLGGSIEMRDDVEIADLTLDSRAVRPGSAFLACRGRRQHGLAFARDAAAAGARAILWEPAPGISPPPDLGSVLLVAVPQLSAQAGFIADRFFDAPSATMALAGVTGTNGKTTCAWLLAQALRRCGRRAAYFGTLGTGLPDALREAAYTTPDAVSLHRNLAIERDAGTGAVAMEVSSHALDQDRCAGVRFQVAAFTNLTRDHLDYHRDMESYAAAKAKLFEWPTLAARVINVDDAFGAELATRLRGSSQLLLTTRSKPEVVRTAQSYVHATRWSATTTGLRIELQTSWGAAQLQSTLLGEFNVDNLLTVMGMLLALDVPLHSACAALSQCAAAPGRMQTLGGGSLPLAVVDYAHTPDALGKALRAARSHSSGKLWCVFGCGGERDSGKRSLMGRLATQLADRVIVTDDNPRSEDPAAIAAAVISGAVGATPVEVIHDRAAAIGSALSRSVPGDVVLVAGKGHEQFQIVGGQRLPFHDIAVVSAALQALQARPVMTGSRA